jgi:hypothetical protein
VTRLSRGLFIRKFGELIRGKLPDQFMQIVTTRAASSN